MSCQRPPTSLTHPMFWSHPSRKSTCMSVTSVVAFEAALKGLAGRIKAHYRAKDAEPPRRLDLYGPDGEVIRTVEMPPDE